MNKYIDAEKLIPTSEKTFFDKTYLDLEEIKTNELILSPSTEYGRGYYIYNFNIVASGTCSATHLAFNALTFKSSITEFSISLASDSAFACSSALACASASAFASAIAFDSHHAFDSASACAGTSAIAVY